jgi:hypothetical protein
MIEKLISIPMYKVILFVGIIMFMMSGIVACFNVQAAEIINLSAISMFIFGGAMKD